MAAVKIGRYRKHKNKISLLLLFGRLSYLLTDSCQKSLPGRVVHSDTTRDVFDTFKARMISALVLLIPKSGQEAEFVVVTDASRVGIAGLLLKTQRFT